MAPSNYSSLGSSRASRGFILFLGFSLVAHVVGLLVWVLVTTHSAPPPARPEIIRTKLVKLGVKRKEKMLPRKKAAKTKPKARVPKDKPTPAKVEPKVEPPKVEAKVEPPKVEKETPKATAKGILDKFAEENDTPKRPDLSKLIDKIADDEGDKEGSKIGEEIRGRLKATYNDKVLALIKSNLTAPQTLNDAERIRLQTQVVVKIGAAGQVLSASIRKSSGNALFDNAALRAAKISKYPPPPLQVRAFYARGVVANVCPTRCS